jgi:hypothetical protein
MDKLGDWIYIIVIVVAGVSSLVSSVRKKNQQNKEAGQPQPYEDTNSGDEFPREEQWFPDTREPWYSPADEVPQQATMTVQEKKAQNRLTDTTFSFPSREGQRSLPNVAEIDLSIPPDDSLGYGGFHLSSETFQDIEETRKAIVYSEILQRKY